MIVLTQAGGFTNEADLDRIEIIRRSGGRKRVYDFSWSEFQRAAVARGGRCRVRARGQTGEERSAHFDYLR